MKHERVKEIFTGRKNLFTVLLALLGGYFVAYPLVNLAMYHLGPTWTVAIGLILLIIGDYLLDVFHKSSE